MTVRRYCTDHHRLLLRRGLVLRAPHVAQMRPDLPVRAGLLREDGLLSVQKGVVDAVEAASEGLPPHDLEGTLVRPREGKRGEQRAIEVAEPAVRHQHQSIGVVPCPLLSPSIRDCHASQPGQLLGQLSTLRPRGGPLGGPSSWPMGDPVGRASASTWATGTVIHTKSATRHGQTRVISQGRFNFGRS